MTSIRLDRWITTSSLSRFKLFGIIHGHFGNEVESDAVVDDGRSKFSINLGIAMVAPAEKITEILSHFAEEEKIEEAEARKRKQSFAVTDVANRPNVTAQLWPPPRSKTEKGE